MTDIGLCLFIMAFVGFIGFIAWSDYDDRNPRRVPSIPDVNEGKHQLHKRVEPDGDYWTWKVWFESSEVPRLIWGNESTNGRCRSQAKAEERCSEVAEDARQRYTAAMSEKMRKETLGRTDVLPL